MTGGNQLRLSTTLGGTTAAQLIRRRNAEGILRAVHRGRIWSPWRRDWV
jgi:cyanophycinase-like exopeptidase